MKAECLVSNAAMEPIPKLPWVLISTLFAVLGVAALMTCAALDSGPTEAQMLDTFVVQVRRIVSPEATPCGLIALDEGATAATACVQRELSRRTAFWVGLQERAIDTYAWTAIAGDTDGALKAVRFSASPFLDSQLKLQFKVWQTPCDRVIIEAHRSPPLSCDAEFRN